VDTATIIYLAIGIGGTVLVAVSLLLGDIFEGLFGVGDGGGAFSLPVLAGFMGCFGYAGAITASVANDNAAVLGALVGVGVAIPGALGISRLLNSLMRQTDETPTATDYVGTTGIVITAIPANKYGEVSIALGGHPRKVSALATTALPAGTKVTVIEAPSETLVVVVDAAANTASANTSTPPPAPSEDVS
jgi:membrane protein implicated in regulation of membrane protease activity